MTERPTFAVEPTPHPRASSQWESALPSLSEAPRPKHVILITLTMMAGPHRHGQHAHTGIAYQVYNAHSRNICTHAAMVHYEQRRSCRHPCNLFFHAAANAGTV